MLKKSALAKDGDTVKIHYTVKLKDGKVFDTTKNKGHLQFTIGKGEVIVGLEQAVIGMKHGEKKSIMVLAHQAYGPYRDDLVLEVDRNRIPDDLDIDIGTRLKIQQKSRQTNIVEVKNITEFKVTLDANHPLAGKDLIFDIELIDIV